MLLLLLLLLLLVLDEVDDILAGAIAVLEVMTLMVYVDVDEVTAAVDDDEVSPFLDRLPNGAILRIREISMVGWFTKYLACAAFVCRAMTVGVAAFGKRPLWLIAPRGLSTKWIPHLALLADFDFIIPLFGVHS